MKYLEFKLKVSIVASDEENAEKQIKEALILNDIELDQIQCEHEEICN